MSILKHVFFLRPLTFLHNVQITAGMFHTFLLATPKFTAILLSTTQQPYRSRASPSQGLNYHTQTYNIIMISVKICRSIDLRFDSVADKKKELFWEC